MGTELYGQSQSRSASAVRVGFTDFTPGTSSAAKFVSSQLDERINLVRGLNRIRIVQVLYTDLTELRFDRG